MQSSVVRFKKLKRQTDDLMVEHAAKRHLQPVKFQAVLNDHLDLYQDPAYIKKMTALWRRHE